MRSIRQTYRQPIKALSGVVLIALAVAVLCVCLGQSLAAANMRSSLESSYTTVALTSTIFTPKTAVSAQMEYGNQGFFRTLVLRNGIAQSLSH